MSYAYRQSSLTCKILTWKRTPLSQSQLSFFLQDELWFWFTFSCQKHTHSGTLMVRTIHIFCVDRFRVICRKYWHYSNKIEHLESKNHVMVKKMFVTYLRGYLWDWAPNWLSEKKIEKFRPESHIEIAHVNKCPEEAAAIFQRIIIYWNDHNIPMQGKWLKVRKYLK